MREGRLTAERLPCHEVCFSRLTKRCRLLAGTGQGCRPDAGRAPAKLRSRHERNPCGRAGYGRYSRSRIAMLVLHVGCPGPFGPVGRERGAFAPFLSTAGDYDNRLRGNLCAVCTREKREKRGKCCGLYVAWICRRLPLRFRKRQIAEPCSHQKQENDAGKRLAQLGTVHGLRRSSGSFAIFAAIRRASSRVCRSATERRPGSSSKYT